MEFRSSVFDRQPGSAVPGVDRRHAAVALVVGWRVPLWDVCNRKIGGSCSHQSEGQLVPLAELVVEVEEICFQNMSRCPLSEI